MHELSLCGSIYQIVERAAAGRPISVIHLQVGRLRQVIPDTLTYCWSLVSEDTELAGSQLMVESMPVTLHCRLCGVDTAVSKDLLLLCGSCESTEVSVTGGEEFLLASLELEEV